MRASLVASGVLPTYDMLYGSQIGLRFAEAVRESGFTELGGSWWPTEERSLDSAGSIFRDGDRAIVYRLPDGALVLATMDNDSIRVQVAAAERGQVNFAIAAFQDRYTASFVNTEGDARVPITFWSYGPHGPVPRLRRIEASPWGTVEGNYTAAVREQLSALMSWSEPGSEGQLILWQGPPGTGKTWALRALASEWASWAEFHYITDPDSFFVDNPAYMVDVLLSESYSVVDSDGGVYEEQAQDKWRVLILEDTGELLSAQAKEKYGQGLSRLLNVVDGMIGQGLRVLVLVTTNDELGELNPAVKRPGRCASQIVFSPLSVEEAATWLGIDAKDAEGLTVAELYARARGGKAPLSETFDADLKAEIFDVAVAHQDEAEGYGETAWDEDTATVLYVAGDWTDTEPIAADFLAIEGVEAFVYEMEALPDGWWDAEVIYPENPPAWVVEPPEDDAELAAVVALAMEPLPRDPEEIATIVAAVTKESFAEAFAHRQLDVMEAMAKHAPPAPVFHVHLPATALGVTVHTPDVTVEPAEVTVLPASIENQIDVHVPEQSPATIHVDAADPTPIIVQMPEQTPPDINVTVAAATPRPVRVEIDADGNKRFVPEEV